MHGRILSKFSSQLLTTSMNDTDDIFKVIGSKVNVVRCHYSMSALFCCLTIVTEDISDLTVVITTLLFNFFCF